MRSILIAYVVNFGLVYTHIQTKTVDEFQNLFDSIANNDTDIRGIYRGRLKQEVAKEQQAFDAMKDEVTLARIKNLVFHQTKNSQVKREVGVTDRERITPELTVEASPANSSQSSQASVANLRSKIFQKIVHRNPASSHKITIIGTGAVGMACAYSLLNQRVTSDLCLIDIDSKKVRGELLDLQHGSPFLNSAKIKAGIDPKLSENSKIIVISAGARQREGESRLSLLERNLNIFKSMIPSLAASSPDAVLLIVSNPVDVLTYMAWKLSGFPQNRVIGAGTNLDTARFRFLISEKLGVSPESVHGWIIGEHGDSSVPVWSSVNIAGVTLKDLNPSIGKDNDTDDWKSIHEQVVSSAYEIIRLKGYTSWAIGASVSDLCSTILSNNAKVHSVSIYMKGLYGIRDEAYLSLPCALGESGVIDVVKQNLNEQELDRLRHSAKIMAEAIRLLDIKPNRR